MFFFVLLLSVLLLCEVHCFQTKREDSFLSMWLNGKEMGLRRGSRAARCVCSLRDNRPIYKTCKCGCSNEATLCCKKCEKKASCFPGDALLLLDNGRLLEMKNVRAGHKILTVRDGQPVFSTVITFLHRQPYKNSTYLTIITEQGNHVTLSDAHDIFVSTNNFTSMESRLAMSVKTGDYIFTTKSCPHGLCPERVAQIAISTKLGVYAPITDTGTIVVNGMVASCYTMVNHDFAHFLTTPFRLFPWLLEPWQEDGFSPIMSNIARATHWLIELAEV